MATTEVMRYQPALAQELQANQGDPAFDHLYDMFIKLPTGEEVKKNLLIVFAGGKDVDGVTQYDAWNTTSTLTLDHFDSVAEKIYFNFSISKIERVKVTVSNGEPTIVTA